MAKDRNRLSPQALRVEDAARLLSALGGGTITAAMIHADIAAGAPTLQDGRINLVQYGAWLVREMGHHGD